MTAVNTTLAAGSDNQAFCYDEQNRLVWAGASGTPSCGASLTAGTLGSAAYTQTFAYDTLDRLTSGPLGSYTYGDTAHLHAVTSIGSGSPTYTANYDAVGDMTCRAPDTTTTCAGTPTGAQLGYDNEGRLSSWQNAPSSPTTTDGFLYDGAGNRVEQLVTVNGSITTSTTYVAGGLEEITSNAVGTTLTKYFTGAGGLPTAERVGTGGPLSYLATDGQGTVSTSLDSAGNVTSQQLYTPYGNSRYSSGSSPTTLGYTGQHADSSTGLDYYNARYYDPVAGQFASADTVADGANRYGYVRGNPTTATDPSGHYQCFDDSCSRSGGTNSSSSGGSSAGTGSTFDGICNQYRCPPPPNANHPGGGGCHGDPACNCYGGCGPSPAQPATSIDIADACWYPGSHPAWCSRYVGEYYSDGTPVSFSRNPIDTADFVYFVIGGGEIVSAQYVVYYVKALGIYMNSLGVNLGVSFNLTGLAILGAGVGQLLAKGFPTGEQVRDFLSGLSGSFSVSVALTGGLMHSSSGFTADIWEVSTSIAAVSIGASYGSTHTPQDFCSPAYLGPIPLPTCVWG